VEHELRRVLTINRRAIISGLALLLADTSGWTVISMKSDWKRIFAFDLETRDSANLGREKPC